MAKPKTTWNYSLETEADRVIQAATQTRQRFYQKYGFFVLPRLISGKANVVFLPELEFSQIPGFWAAVEKTKLDIPMPVSKKIHQEVKRALDTSEVARPARQRLRRKALAGGRDSSDGERKRKRPDQKLKKEWKTKETAFWQTLFEIFPDLTKKKIEVEIRPTSFGSISSFNLAGIKRKNLKVKIYIRLDMSPAQIAEAILSSLFKPKLERQNYGWEETEGVIDFLLQYTKLKEIFPDYKPTLKAVRGKEEGKLAVESQKYLKKLGIPTGEVFSASEGKILIDGKNPKEKFSLNEKKVLALLVANKNQLCSFDQIGDVIWQEKADELFSVWAISKLIQRIRNKLQANGISSAVIQTQRGQGYVLRD